MVCGKKSKRIHWLNWNKRDTQRLAAHYLSRAAASFTIPRRWGIPRCSSVQETKPPLLVSLLIRSLPQTSNSTLVNKVCIINWKEAPFAKHLTYENYEFSKKTSLPNFRSELQIGRCSSMLLRKAVIKAKAFSKANWLTISTAQFSLKQPMSSKGNHRLT